tara:strand:+ start:6527 stop:6769 length:243 start_codon:yes stop_codon:yes gene_type:complete
MISEEPFVTIDNVAKHFSVSKSTVRGWVRENRIPKDTYIRIGNTLRFKISGVSEALIQFSKDTLSTVDMDDELDLLDEDN